VRHAVVLVAVVDVAHLPALLHGGGADDGAEGHGERNDDHGEWFHHLGRREAVLGTRCLGCWTENVLELVLVCVDFRWRYGIPGSTAQRLMFEWTELVRLI
jgi:hypothetical protein